MLVQELGALNDAILLFGGPYSNLQATRALVARTRTLGIGAARVICTGDIVAYCGEPAETVAEIRKLGCTVVAGNCEVQLAENRLDCGCGFDEGSTCDLLSAGWYGYADRSIGPADRSWMAGLPALATFTHQGLRCAVIHGGVTDISRFVWPVSADALFHEEIEYLQSVTGPVDVIFAGHAGIPFRKSLGNCLWVNAGVIGMPANDGSTETHFVVFENGEVTLHRLSYDHGAAAARMRENGLIQGYDAGLLSGYWPSEEVLPPELRRPGSARG